MYYSMCTYIYILYVYIYIYVYTYPQYIPILSQIHPHCIPLWQFYPLQYYNIYIYIPIIVGHGSCRKARWIPKQLPSVSCPVLSEVLATTSVPVTGQKAEGGPDGILKMVKPY